MYLDPMICDSTLNPPWTTWITSDYANRRAVADFWATLTAALGIDPKIDTPTNFLQETGLGTRFSQDRILQVKTSQTINRQVEKLTTTGRRFLAVTALMSTATDAPGSVLISPTAVILDHYRRYARYENNSRHRL